MKNKKSRNTQGMRQWKKFKRNKMAVIALILLGILIFASAFAPLLTSYDPEAISLTERTLAPSKTHLLGTDKVGRDVFTRLLYGGRISILIGLTGALGGAIIGAALGCLGGYFGGLLDRFLLRLSELFTTFPQTILVLILVAFMGQGVWNLFIVFWCTGWMGTYRMTRREDPQSARGDLCAGLPGLRHLQSFDHVPPHSAECSGTGHREHHAFNGWLCAAGKCTELSGAWRSVKYTDLGQYF